MKSYEERRELFKQALSRGRTRSVSFASTVTAKPGKIEVQEKAGIILK